jgi:FdrA protein
VLVMGPTAGRDRLRPRARLRQRRPPRSRSGRRGVGHRAPAGVLPARHGRRRVSHVLGVGGRDLSEAVGGLATLDALALLDADPATERVLLVSKPPAPSVAVAVAEAAAELSVAGALGPRCRAEAPTSPPAVEALLGTRGVRCGVAVGPALTGGPPAASSRALRPGLPRRRVDADRRPGLRATSGPTPRCARATTSGRTCPPAGTSSSTSGTGRAHRRAGPTR